jgi:hypothetical protein
MPDIIKRKALEEQEKKRQPEKRLDLMKAVHVQLPERKIEWVDPPKHTDREAHSVPLPNYTGGKAEAVPQILYANEPIRMQKLPYLIDTQPRVEAQTGEMPPKPSSISKNEVTNKNAQAPTMAALFDAVSPFGKGLAKIIALLKQKPDEAERLFRFMQSSEKDPGSSYYRPYAQPTNKGAMNELNKLGIDTSNVDEQWFHDNAWLKRYVRTGAAGIPKVPAPNSSREETAAYYYKRLENSEGRTLKAEAELQGLRREIGYWAGRKDRNYSDEEVVSRINWNKYPTLTMLREEQQKGRPAPLNRAVDFDSDTVIGMLWSARNGKTGGSSTAQAARYALGEGKQYQPDENVRAMRDPKSFAYNPYALGSTVDEAAEYFGVDSFDEKWLNRNLSILKSGNETAIRHYQQAYDAEQFTLAAENENRKLSDRISARLNKAVSAGVTLDANVLLKDALFGLDTLQRMDEGLKSGNLAQLTRPVNYRWQDVAGQVSDQVQMINTRQNAPHKPADLEIAARNEEEKVLQGQGTLIQKDAVPGSYTSFHESMPGLWAAGLAKNPLSAGWYVPAGGGQSVFSPDQIKTQAASDARRAGDFSGAAAQEYDALTGCGADISTLSTHEGAVRMAADLALDAAKAFTPEQLAIPERQAAAGRYDTVVNSIFGIDPTSVARILPQILNATTVQGDIKNQAAGTAGLLSVLLRLDEGALATVTDHVLGDDSSLQTVQTMFRVLKLRDMETESRSEAFQVAEDALKKAAGKTLQSSAAQTGDGELDDLTGIANKSSHNLDAVLQRWGIQGVNYIGNLLQAGRGDLAAVLTAMPTYAKSAIVAETNMRTFGLNEDAIAAQENALAADMKSPIVVLSAKQIAKQQAVEARKAELTAGGTFKVQSVLVQKVNNAAKTVNQSKPVLDQAVRIEQAGRDALAKVQDLFHKNMADTAAADTVTAAIDQLQKAIDARAKAQKTFALNQQTLFDAKQMLDGAQKQAAARVEKQAKQDVDAKRLSLAEERVKLKEQAMGQAEEQENVLLGQIMPENVSNDGNTLAQIDGSSIMKVNTQNLGLDSADKKKISEAYQDNPLLSKETLLRLKAGGKSGAPSSDLLKTIVPGNTQLSGLRTDGAETLLGKENKPVRALASAAAATDVGYANGTKEWPQSGAPSYVTDEHGNIQYGADGDVDLEFVDSYPDVTPKPTPVLAATQAPSTTTEPTPTPTPTLSASQYTVNVFKTGDYARNQNIYPGVTEWSLMPLDYLKQAQAQLKVEGVIYPGDGIIYHFDSLLSNDEVQTKDSEEHKRRLETDCVGMIVLPAMMWYSDDVFEYLKGKDMSKIKTNVEYTYTNSSHKGEFTKDIFDNGKMFDGMQLIGLDDEGKKDHIVTFYKEFVCDGVVYKDVVVDISGDRYKKDPITGKSIVDEKTKSDNTENNIKIRSFEEAYDKGKYKYWCAPDYIDYGDQTDPDGNLLTPKKQWEERKKK